jgi:hypothetical protein
MSRSLLAAAAMVLLATTAQATTLSRSGVWESFYVKGDKGTPICGMQVVGRDAKMFVKYTGGDVFIQIMKLGWRIPQGTEIPGYVAFDTSDHLPFVGSGRTVDGVGIVEVKVTAGTEADFLHEFGEASTFTIGFDAGTQPPMVANMAGSRDATTTFRRCMTFLDAQPAQQPFARKDDAQPFGKQPATQTKKKDDGSV